MENRRKERGNYKGESPKQGQTSAKDQSSDFSYLFTSEFNYAHIVK